MTQREAILEALRAAGEHGVCISELPLHLSYTARNRVSALRAEGYNIRSERCRLHAHTGPIRRYWLVPEPVQLELVPT